MNNRLTVTKDAISRALDQIADPISGKSLAASGRVQGLLVREDGRVSFVIEAPADAAEAYEKVRASAEKAVKAAPGVKGVSIVLTAERPRGAAPHGQAQGQNQGPQSVANVNAVIAVSSAKGGVGKSTVAVNLAAAFAALGKRTGLLDADIYGPSLPTMLSGANLRPEMGADKKLLPVQRHGLATMSIGYLVDAEQPMVWRGAMATGAIRQLIDDVHWGTPQQPLDVLVIDLPPGTGDIQLTLTQRVALNGAVIVSTPQEIALADVRRGIAMFEKTRVPLLGVIENMAYFEDASGKRVHIFGEGGARRTAKQFSAPFLGEIPIDVALRQSGDAGKPLVLAQPESAVSKRFLEIAEAVLAGLAAGQKPAPTIRFV